MRQRATSRHSFGVPVAALGQHPERLPAERMVSVAVEQPKPVAGRWSPVVVGTLNACAAP